MAEFGTDKEMKEQSKQTVQLRQERETISLVAAPVVKEPAFRCKPAEERRARSRSHNLLPPPRCHPPVRRRRT
jgi:hypothetical protein